MQRLTGIFVFLTLLFVSHAKDYYVSRSGSDASGNGSEGRPWRTLKYASTQVAPNEGHVIHLSAGRFEENTYQITIPNGVSVKGAGKDLSILTVTEKYRRGFVYWPEDVFHFEWHFLKVGSNTSLEGFTIDGQGKKLFAGIFAENFENLTINNIKIDQTFYNGLWLWDGKKLRISGLETYDCTWSHEGGALAGITMSQLEDAVLEDLRMVELEGRGKKGSPTYQGGGQPIGTWGKTKDSNYLRRITIRNSYLEAPPIHAWKIPGTEQHPGAFSIEWPDVILENILLEKNHFKQGLSLVDVRNNKPDSGYTVQILNNTIEGKGFPGSNMLEISNSKVEIAYNYIRSESEQGIVNWTDCDNQNFCGQFRDWDIHHNVFEDFVSGNIIYSKRGISNLRFYQNTVFLSKGPVGILVVHNDDSGNSLPSKNITIANNIFYRLEGPIDPTAHFPYEDVLIHTRDGHVVEGVVVSRNIFKGFPMDNIGELFRYKEEENSQSDPGLRMEGFKPFPFFEPMPGSKAEQMKAGAKAYNSFSGPALVLPKISDEGMTREEQNRLLEWLAVGGILLIIGILGLYLWRKQSKKSKSKRRSSRHRSQREHSTSYHHH